MDVRFGFIQVFPALALLGFTVSGADAGLLPAWHTWLGYLSAALLFAGAALSHCNAVGASRFAIIGRLGWILACSVELIRR